VACRFLSFFPELLTQRKFVSVELFLDQSIGFDECELLTQRKFVSAILTQRKFVSVECPTLSPTSRPKLWLYSNAHKPPKTVAVQRKFVSAECHTHLTPTNRPKLWLLRFDAIIQICTEMYCSHQYLSIGKKKVCHAHSNAHKKKFAMPTLTPTNRENL